MKNLIIMAVVPLVIVLLFTVKYLIVDKPISTQVHDNVNTPDLPKVVTEYIEVPIPGVCPKVKPKVKTVIKKVEVPMECKEAQLVAYYKKLISELKTKNQRLEEDIRMIKMTGFDNPYKHSK